MKVPAGWRVVPLAEVASKAPNAIVDGPFGSNLKLSDYVEDGVPVLQGKNITGYAFRWFDVRFVSEEKAHSLRRSLTRVGDILIVKIGSIGYSAILDDLHGHPYALIPANLCKITPDLEVVDRQYLAYCLASNHSVQYLRASASATSQPALSLRKVKELAVPLPPLPEQKRIAAILAQADRLRRLRRTARELSDTYLQSVFLEMFGDPVSNPRHFPTVRFGDVCETRLGKMLDVKQQTGRNLRPYLRNVNVQWGRIDLSDLQEMDFDARERDTLRLKSGDVLICEGGEVGRAAIWRDELSDCYYQKALHRARPNPSLAVPEFIVWLMWCLASLGGLADYTSQVTIAHLTGVKLKALEFPLPPLGLQQQFAHIAHEFERLRAQQREAQRQAEHLFQTLLHRAFHGEL